MYIFYTKIILLLLVAILLLNGCSKDEDLQSINLEEGESCNVDLELFEEFSKRNGVLVYSETREQYLIIYRENPDAIDGTTFYILCNLPDISEHEIPVEFSGKSFYAMEDEELPTLPAASKQYYLQLTSLKKN